MSEIIGIVFCITGFSLMACGWWRIRRIEVTGANYACFASGCILWGFGLWVLINLRGI